MRYLVFAITLMFTALAAQANPLAPAAPAVPNPAFAQPQKGEWVLGKPGAKVVVTEYASLSCSHCADFHKRVFPVIAQKYIDTGKVRFVFRDFPLNAPALRGGQLLRCAPEAKRQALLSTLFERQKQWAFDPKFETHLQTIGIEQGMSKRSVRLCLADKDLENKVAQSRLDGAQQLGVNGTPALYVNGERFSGFPEAEGLSALIEKHLALNP